MLSSQTMPDSSQGNGCVTTSRSHLPRSLEKLTPPPLSTACTPVTHAGQPPRRASASPALWQCRLGSITSANKGTGTPSLVPCQAGFNELLPTFSRPLLAEVKVDGRELDTAGRPLVSVWDVSPCKTDAVGHQQLAVHLQKRGVVEPLARHQLCFQPSKLLPRPPLVGAHRHVQERTRQDGHAVLVVRVIGDGDLPVAQHYRRDFGVGVGQLRGLRGGPACPTVLRH
mmetsp:Transcript_2970/g.8364  ORF Transcript_2970/g.8364 Transcript_2970/m.8364 type:complete len:227 (+) Transcript_2970:463-1143(+)